MSILRLSISLFLITGGLQAGWIERKAEGWAFYEDEERSQERVSKEEPAPPSPQEQLHEVKRNLEMLLADALLNPTPDNTLRYMKAQQDWLLKSARFSNSWRKVLLAHPELDPTATSFAVSHYGRQIQKNLMQEEKDQLILSLTKQYGLFFFYEGGSKISQAFAKVVKAFTVKYQWTLVGITVDGISLSEIPTQADSNTSEKLGIRIFPALIAFDPKTHVAVPLAFGLKALDQIENSVLLQFQKQD